MLRGCLPATGSRCVDLLRHRCPVAVSRLQLPATGGRSCKSVEVARTRTKGEVGGGLSGGGGGVYACVCTVVCAGGMNGFL